MTFNQCCCWIRECPNRANPHAAAHYAVLHEIDAEAAANLATAADELASSMQSDCFTALGYFIVVVCNHNRLFITKFSYWNDEMFLQQSLHSSAPGRTAAHKPSPRVPGQPLKRVPGRTQPSSLVSDDDEAEQTHIKLAHACTHSLSPLAQ